MFGPPSSPPPTLTGAQQDGLRSALLPAFGQEPRNSSPSDSKALFKPREFVQTKYKIYSDEDASEEHQSGFLPTPLPTSEANIQGSSPPPSSPQTGLSASETALVHSIAASNRTALQQMILVRVPTCGPNITIGRSSKSSDYAVKPSNRLASRVHAKLSFNTDENLLSIECLGWNGLSVSVPNSKPDGFERNEFKVTRGQILNIERVDGVTLDIHGDKALVEICNDYSHASEVTEDEVWSQLSPNKASATSSEVQPPAPKRLRLELDDSAELNSDTSKQEQDSLDKKIKEEALVQADGTVLPAEVGQTAAADNDTPTLEMTQTAEASSAPAMISGNDETATAPLEPAAAEESVPKNSQNEQRLAPVSQTSSRASSLEPSSENHGRKPRKTLEPIPVYLKKELGNVVVNHIAFSRQSAVPFGSVKRANQRFSSYSRSQLQEFIRSLDCIGVIEGGVEDTTGRKAEDEYYYVPERDDNEERKAAVQNSKGHRSLRNCRKTPKQYFYRPLNLN